MMLPTLESLADKQTHTIRDVSDAVAKRLGVSEQDCQEKLPSGGQTRWTNRIAWVGVHLRFAKLITRPARGQLQITERGLEVLKTKPKRIDLRFLRQFPEYNEARASRRDEDNEPSEATDKELASPLETLEKSVGDLRQALSAELLEIVKSRTPQFFERLVLELMQKLGYGSFVGDAAEHLGQGGDRGLDGLIREDKLGLDVIYIQAKRWDGPVGPATVREFLGALD
jgi:restriction system protein